MSIKYKQYLDIKRNSWKIDDKRTEETVKYCEDCKTCYEILDGQTWNTSKIQYLPDFPTYKKKRQTCPSCLKGDIDVK